MLHVKAMLLLQASEKELIVMLNRLLLGTVFCPVNNECVNVNQESVNKIIWRIYLLLQNLGSS